jgi:polyhydroxyalkanoate synthesis regulator phasin
MEDFWSKAKSFSLGLADFTKEKVESLVDEMVKRGELTQEESDQAVAKIMEKAKAEQEDFTEKITAMIDQAISNMGLARAADLEALEKRVAALEKKLKKHS